MWEAACEISAFYQIKCSNEVWSVSLTEQTRHYETRWNEHILIEYPRGPKKWTMTFTPKGQMDPETLMDGSLIIKDNRFSGRIRAVMDGIIINSRDSGTFEFRDPEGNLILSAQLEVTHGKQQSISPHRVEVLTNIDPHPLHHIP